MNNCIEYKGHKIPSGYGTTKVGGKTVYAHRRAWEIVNGSIPEGLCVLHKCDNPSCINPEHLFLGTQLENIEDRNSKGRTFGKYWRNIGIMVRMLQGTSQSETAREFGVHPSFCNRLWKKLLKMGVADQPSPL